MQQGLIVAIVTTLIGLVIGYFWGRIQARTDSEKKQVLQEQLQQNRHELEDYRRNVTEHFNSTAQLMQQMTEQYKAVYQHLAKGAQTLTDGDAQLLTEGSSQRLPGGDSSEVAATGEEEQAAPREKSVAEDEQIGLKKEKAPADSTAKPQAEGAADEARKSGVEDKVTAARQAGL